MSNTVRSTSRRWVCAALLALASMVAIQAQAQAQIRLPDGTETGNGIGDTPIKGTRFERPRSPHGRRRLPADGEAVVAVMIQRLKVGLNLHR